MRRIGVTALMIVATVVFAPVALAQDSDADRQHARAEFDRGVQLYTAGSYQSALEAFQEAFRLAPHPTVRLNMANCYDHLNKPVEAIFHFEHYLTEAGRGVAAAQRRDVESSLERLRERVGQLNLRVAPDGARITIDGTEERRAPVLEPVTLPAGTHRVETSLNGYVTDRRTVEVPGGGHADLSLRLDRMGSGGGQVANNGMGPPNGGNGGRPPNGGGGGGQMMNNGGPPNGGNGGGNGGGRPPNGGGGGGGQMMNNGGPPNGGNGGGPPNGGGGGGGGQMASNNGGGMGGSGVGNGGGGEPGGGASGGGGGGDDGSGGGSIQPPHHDRGGSDDVFQIGDLHVTVGPLITAITASVAGTAAIICALVAVNANAAFDTDANTAMISPPDRDAALADAIQQHNTAVSASNWADGLGITSLVAIGATVVLLLVTQPSGEPAPMALVPTVTRDGAGLMLHGVL